MTLTWKNEEGNLVCGLVVKVFHYWGTLKGSYWSVRLSVAVCFEHRYELCRFHYSYELVICNEYMCGPMA